METESQLYLGVCGPLALVSTVLSVIFILCLCHPVAGVNLHQPLRFLLIVVVGNSTIQHGTTMLMILLILLKGPKQLLVVLKALMYLSYCSCFSSSAWISIFYHVKIVPLHCALQIWVKKNIRIVVYVGVLWGHATLLSAIILGTVPYLRTPPSYFNSTSSPANRTTVGSLDLFLEKLCDIVFVVYLVFPLITLTVSWIRIFVYLRGHIRQMKESTGSSSSLQQKNQKRVAVMGMVQAAVFLPSCVWTMFTVIVHSIAMPELDSKKFLTLTICSVSDFAKIICLGLSQTVFRFTLAAKWNELRKALGLRDHTEETESESGFRTTQDRFKRTSDTGGSLQGPLRHLLTWCVGFGLFFEAATLSVIYTFYDSTDQVLIFIVGILHYFSACISLVSPSWLSIFYYFSIVPQKVGIMTWTKRNISVVLLCYVLVDSSLIALSTALIILSELQRLSEQVPGLMSNLTSNLTGSEKEEFPPSSFSVSSALYLIHLQLTVWTLALTWGATFIYLRRHMSAMTRNSGSLTQPAYRSQMRVTIIGLVQAVFFLSSGSWVTVEAIIQKGVVLHIGLITVCSMLGLVNTVCLGLSQSVFRQQVLLMGKAIWSKLSLPPENEEYHVTDSNKPLDSSTRLEENTN
ncbi:hypothetical protein NFI96_008367 [Prochilodus magdalenae]|nr:hypothetical protein NFI96_008367 [Prochilodus magdalenae]